MTILSNALWHVLRRRAARLIQLGHPDEFIAPILRAADELQVRARCLSKENTAQEAVELCAENKLLRMALEQTYHYVKALPVIAAKRDEITSSIARVLVNARGPKRSRRMLVLEVTDTSTPESLRAALDERLEELTRRDEDGEANDGQTDEATDAAQPGGAGRDTDQHPQAEAGPDGHP